MARRTGSRAALIEDALMTVMSGKSIPVSKVFSKACEDAGYDLNDGKLLAVELPKLDGVKATYVAPQVNGKGKPTVDGATLGAKSWRSAWFSLTVNSYRRDGDGPAAAIALANSFSGEPFVTYKGKVYLVVNSAMVADAKKSIRA